jgi:rare lipoprotein A
LCLLAGCASNPKYRDTADSPDRAPKSTSVGEVYQKGIASYYGKKFHGRKTASGEVYDMYAMTAAHRTLPFGTIVEVENHVNGRRVIVKINDRGPFVPGRILDLSKGAAQKLGMIGNGTAMVSIKVKKWGK